MQIEKKHNKQNQDLDNFDIDDNKYDNFKDDKSKMNATKTRRSSQIKDDRLNSTNSEPQLKNPVN